VKGGIIIIGGVPAVSNVSPYAGALRVNPLR